MQSTRFETALKKGEVGERIVRDILESRGWIVYRPVTDGAHAFDMLSIKDKTKAIAIDVKAKSRLNAYAATGIDEKHYQTYRQFSIRHNMPFWLFFVDEMSRTIYGNDIDKLDVPVTVDGIVYPKMLNGFIRLWSLKSMKTIATISDTYAAELKSYNQRSYAYTPHA